MVLKKVFYVVIILSLLGCSFPKVFVRSSSGWVTYNRMTRTLEIVWESTTETPPDSTQAEKVSR